MKAINVKGYLKLSILIEVIILIIFWAVYILRALQIINYLTESNILIPILTILSFWIWSLINLFLIIYFKAKEYDMKDYIVPILFIIQGMMTFMISPDNISFAWILTVFTLFICGISAYLLWKE